MFKEFELSTEPAATQFAPKPLTLAMLTGIERENCLNDFSTVSLHRALLCLLLELSRDSFLVWQRSFNSRRRCSILAALGRYLEIVLAFDINKLLLDVVRALEGLKTRVHRRWLRFRYRLYGVCVNR